MKTYVGICRDHSGSMTSLREPATKDYNETIGAIKENALATDQDTIVSVIKCDSSIPMDKKFEHILSSINSIKPIRVTDYICNGMTPLFDTVGLLIEQFKSVPDYDDPSVTFLLLVITVGEENESGTQWINALGPTIKDLQNSDRWTFAFRVPKGYSKKLMNLGIPIGNILEWDQTKEGVSKSTEITKVAITKFYVDKSQGKKSTDTFYTNLSGLTEKKLNSKLENITSDVTFWSIPKTKDGIQIREFCDSKLKRPMIKGSAFYQLMKPEKQVQDYKVIAIRDKVSTEVYTGAHARQLLGLPYNGTVKVIPGNHSKYDIFIQSTSVNRKLVAGTQLMYWEAGSI